MLTTWASTRHIGIAAISSSTDAYDAANSASSTPASAQRLVDRQRVRIPLRLIRRLLLVKVVPTYGGVLTHDCHFHHSVVSVRGALSATANRSVEGYITH